MAAAGKFPQSFYKGGGIIFYKSVTNSHKKNPLFKGRIFSN
jgi:hypothetical protein